MSLLQERYQRLHGDDPEAARVEAERLRASGRRVVAVSACLLGVRCRYDGGDKASPEAVARAAGDDEILPVCPEVLARFGVPRPAVTLSEDGARAFTADGRDVTAQLDAGAARAERLVELAGASSALLKERSPSCGSRTVYGPRGLQAGRGRFAARLGRLSLPIISEEDR
jgi:uncharacterized protein YbbK (DUF523 family)